MIRFAVAALLALTTSGLAAHPAIELRIEQLSQMLTQAPEAAPLLLLRGAAHSEHGESELALADFHAAIALGAEKEGALFLARHFHTLSEHKAALIQLARYKALGGDNIMAMLTKARALAGLGDTAAAIESYVQYFAVADSVHPGDVVSAARLVAAASTDGQQAALTLIDGLPAALKNSVVVVDYATSVSTQLGRHEQALQRWQGLAHQMQHSARWQKRKAMLLIAAGSMDEAKLALDSAHQLIAGQRETPAVLAMRAELDALGQQLDQSAR